MCKNIAADFTLPTLHDLDVGFHASLGIVLGEEVRDIGVGVETTELRIR